MDETKPWCTCTNRDRQEGWSHAGDQVWVHPGCGKQSRMNFERWLGMENPERYFSLPPRGVTVSTASFGGEKRYTYTYFCDANPECYAVSYGSTEESARSQLKGHVCPTEARRDAHPSGRPVIQKAWDELDDVIEAIKTKTGYNEMHGVHLLGYATGVAEVLAYLAIPHFRLRDDILREANKRWKVRHGLIPWAATPGYNFFPGEPLKYAHATAPEAKQTVRRTASKSTPMKPATPPAATVRTFTPDEVKLIRDSLYDNGIPAEDLAKMYGCTADRIRTVAGPREQVSIDLPPMLGLF